MINLCQFVIIYVSKTPKAHIYKMFIISFRLCIS